jgi:hypothetical protein
MRDPKPVTPRHLAYTAHVSLAVGTATETSARRAASRRPCQSAVVRTGAPWRSTKSVSWPAFARKRQGRVTGPLRPREKVGSVSVEDVAIVRRWREVLVDDDTEAAAALLARDIEWVVVSGESLRGIDEVRKYYAGSGLGGPENLDVEFDPGVLEDLGNGRVFRRQPPDLSLEGHGLNSLTSGRHGSNTRSVMAPS